MGLFQGFLGNASKADASAFMNEWGGLIAKDETVVSAYKLVRDWITITDKRLIYIDIKGMTGAKKAITSIPWNKLAGFQIVSAGILDLDAELRLWVTGTPVVIEVNFSRSVNVYEVQSVIADAIATFGGSGSVGEPKPVVEEKPAPKKTLADLDI